MKGVRFAPSPTGPFHLGNLRTAWVSWFIARLRGEPWVVRFEDIDALRSIPGVQDAQLADLKKLGLCPEVVEVQSSFSFAHWSAFIDGVRSGAFYPCLCSRKEVQQAIAQSASAPHHLEPHYSGHCRAGLSRERMLGDLPPTMGWRYRDPDVVDGTADFIVARTKPVVNWRDAVDSLQESFVPAYHFACAYDDWRGQYSVLVRAWDLESATAIQRKLMSVFEGRSLSSDRTPAVFHTSLVNQDDGNRLEKRTSGAPLSDLIKVGWTCAGIADRFELSFSTDDRARALNLHAAAIDGETKKTIAFSDIAHAPVL